MKILVLAKDASDRLVIETTAQKSGYEVVLAKSAEEILKLVESGASRLVITDGEESNGDGKGVVQQIRSAKIEGHIHIIKLVEKNWGTASITQTKVDDILFTPLIPAELKARLKIAERMITLEQNLIAARDELTHQAMYDGLTELMNRPAIYKFAQGELERARRLSSPFSLILLDIDNLTEINKEYGQDVGDNVLKVITKTIREKSRPYDGIGRWAGDTFMIVLPSTEGNDGEKIATRIIRGVNALDFSLDTGEEMSVHISGGISCTFRISASAEQLDELIHAAEQALQASQQAGGNQVSLTFL
jgi:two-component system cell cycle response regulator